jgi:hypothetical protein
VIVILPTNSPMFAPNSHDDQTNNNSLILFVLDAVQRDAPHELAGCPPQW